MAMDGDDGVGGGEEFSESFDGSRRRKRRRAGGAFRFWAIGAAVIVAVGAGVFAFRSYGLMGEPRVVARTINWKLKGALKELDAASERGDVKAYFAARSETGDAVVAWIEDFSKHASLDTPFNIGEEEVCEGCTLLPKASKVLSGPVPPSVLKNMSQLDKDRFDLKNLHWKIVQAFVPAFERMCDRYVDPATGKPRAAKPD